MAAPNRAATRKTVSRPDPPGALFGPAERVGEVFDLAESIRDTERRQANRIGPGSRCAPRSGSGPICRPENPALAFREHLRAVGGGIEE